MKKFLKIISISFISLSFLVVAAVLFFTSSPGENLVRGWLEERLTVEIGQPVIIAGFETNFWSHAQIDSLSVLSPDSNSSGKKPILFLGLLRVEYSIPQLLRETVTLKKLYADKVDVGVKLDSLGNIGLPLIDNPEKAIIDTSEKSVAFQIETISLNRVNLNYFDKKVPLSFELAGALLSARGNEKGLYSGNLSAANIFALYDSLVLNFNGIEAAASFDGEVVKLEKVKADCQGLHLEASGDFSVDNRKNISLTVLVDGSFDSLASAIAEAFEFSPVKAGQMSAQCRVEGVYDKPTIKLKVDLNDLLLRDVAVESALLEAEYSDEFFRVDTFQLAAFDGIINGNAGVSFDSLGAVSFNLALDKIAFASVWKSIYSENSPYRGVVSGLVSGHGQGSELTSWIGAATITGERLSYLNKSIPELKCLARLASGRTDFSLFHGVDTINANINFAEDKLQGTFDLSIRDLTALARFIDQPELSGSLRGKGTLDGSFSNPTVRSAVNGSGLVYRNFPVDLISAEISFKDSLLTLIRFSCDGTLDSIDTEQPPFGIDSIEGSGTYECRLSGPLNNLSGDLIARLEKPRYGSYDLDSLSINAKLDGSQVTVTELVASRGELGGRLKATFDTLTTSGSFDLLLLPRRAEPDSGGEESIVTANGKDELGLINGRFTLGKHADLSAVAHGEGIWLGLVSLFTEETIISGGELEFDLTLDGPYLTPTANFSATSRSIELSDYQIDSISTHIRLVKERIILDSLISYALDQRTRAAGQLELSVSPDGYLMINDNASVAMELNTKDFDLSVLNDLILPGGELSGIISTSLNLNGTLEKPRLDGWLTGTKGRFLMTENSVPVENVSLSLLFKDSLLTIDSTVGNVSNIDVGATGSLLTSNFKSAIVDLNVNVGRLGKLNIDGTVADSNVQLQVLSDSLNLAVFQPFIIELDSLSGRLSCRVLIAGNPTAPEMDGSLQITSMSFTATRQYAKLSNGYARLRFDRNRIIIDSSLASVNGGTVVLAGQIEHAQGELLDLGLKLRANGITLKAPDRYVIAVDSASLSYGKQLENYILDGDIYLGEARMTAGVRPTSVLPWVKSIETVDIELPELIARSRLNVRIRESDELWIDNNLAHILLRVELGIIGTPLRPNFTGLVQIKEGYLIYLDRRFKVNEGTVYFNDPARFNPNINLDAGTEVTVYRRTVAETYKVFIKATGLLDQLQYGLYSEPALDKPDIVALLTLGATRTELAGGSDNNGKGGFTGVLKDRAAMLTSQRLSGYLSRKTGSLFGFDEFTIQGNLFQFDEKWGPQLIASKRLSQNVNLTYSTTVGQLNDQTVRLGYRLTPRFSLQGETNRQGRAGLDIKYGITFK